MRGPWLAIALVACCGGGCDDNEGQPGGASDLAAPRDLARPDLLTPTTCSPTDPMNDGLPCGATCPDGTIGVNLDGACKCFTTCTTDPQCSCNRFCDPVTRPDAGVVASACLPGNAPGQRCGRDSSTNMPFGNVFCGQLTVCVNADPARLFRYCNYKCTTQLDCPEQTTCQPLLDSMGNLVGNVCAYNSGPNGNKNLDEACGPGDVCKTGLLCDTLCRPQCDGPGATCATGTCNQLADPATHKIIGYICR